MDLEGTSLRSNGKSCSFHFSLFLLRITLTIFCVILEP